MTVCLAYVDQKTGDAWIGSDSCASDSISHSVVNNHKCFNPVGRRDIVMACAGTFRLPNLLEYIPGIFPDESELPTEQIDIGYLVNEFTPVLNALEVPAQAVRHPSPNHSCPVFSPDRFRPPDSQTHARRNATCSCCRCG